MNTSLSREAFEAWYQASHTTAIVKRSTKGYIDKTTRVAWRAWQAANEAASSAAKPFAYYDPSSGQFALDKSDLPIGAQVWPLIRQGETP